MVKKSIYNNKTLLLGAALVGGYLLYAKSQEAREADGEGSLGGTDDLLEHQGFDVDPNSVPDQPDEYQKDTSFYIITPEGQVTPDNSIGNNVSSNIPIASTGSGTLFQDAAITGGAIGTNLMLPSIAKRINKLLDTKYISDALSLEKTPIQSFIKDPYAINDLVLSKSEKTGTREIAQLAVDRSGKTILKTIPKWVKNVKIFANFIPLADIPIGAGLDVYFTRNEKDPSRKIDWKSAIMANTAGELAQLSVMAGGAAAGSVIPVAGNIAGGTTGFVVGTGADIAATELYYRQTGKSSLFGSKSSGNIEASKIKQALNIAPSKSSNGSSSVSSSSASGNVFGVSTSIPTPFKSSSSSGSSGSSKSSKSVSKASTPRTSPKTSVVSRVTSRVASTVSKVSSRTSKVKSVASKVRSWFSRRKK